VRIDALDSVQIGGITQWLRVRGTDAANPPLLVMQQGPGLPMISEARRFERLLRLEEAFAVIYWDQRGTGLSALPLRGKPFEISATRMVSDTVSLLGLLRDRFGGKTFIAGFSFGATFAARAAVERPELVAALVTAGMDVDIPAAELNAYNFALATARKRGNRRAIRQLEAIGQPPHLQAKQFSTRARWVGNFGGLHSGMSFNAVSRALLTGLIRSPDYSPAAIVRAVRGNAGRASIHSILSVIAAPLGNSVIKHTEECGRNIAEPITVNMGKRQHILANLGRISLRNRARTMDF
jgi:pimeloyl-ACP methyl ester carboxylesterase